MSLSADVRRVVTTIDAKDKAVVLFDGPNPHKKVRPHAQTVSRVIWVTDQTPADLSGTKDRADIDIDMLLDDSEIHLKAGDVLVQQATNHAWVNRGCEPCRIAFVLIDAKEP